MFFCLVMMSCFLIWGNLTSLWAADTDTTCFINSLKDKKIITQEEADSGLSYDLSAEFMAFAVYEHRAYESVAAGSDYNKYQIGFQFKF
jgi:hypothetical protein